MIQNIITDDKWLWSWGDLQKILDFLRNSGCILKNNGSNEFSVFENMY